MSGETIQRLKELEQERSGLVENAKKEALARAKEAIAELRLLGFDYELKERSSAGSKKAGKAGGKASGRGVTRAAPCPICEFQTDPPHDARKHRAQGKRKRPYTEKQLLELGLTKV